MLISDALGVEEISEAGRPAAEEDEMDEASADTVRNPSRSGKAPTHSRAGEGLGGNAPRGPVTALAGAEAHTMMEALTAVPAAETPISISEFANAAATLVTALVDALNIRGQHRVEIVQALANDLHEQATALPRGDARKAVLTHMALAVMARE